MVIIDGAVAGVLSSVMIRMGGKEAQINEKLKAAKMWMREQRIPKEQAAKALDYFRLVYKSRVMYEESEILNTMPPAMKLLFSTQVGDDFKTKNAYYYIVPTFHFNEMQQESEKLDSSMIPTLARGSGRKTEFAIPSHCVCCGSFMRSSSVKFRSIEAYRPR
jgi:hypothetical protein|eukprot:COSAG06_NODE_13874_length_1210_cov_1.583258_2_plen_162_part_00